MPHKSYTQQVIDTVVKYALRAARAHQDGEKTISLGEGSSRQELRVRGVWDPKTKSYRGYCARFVRQIYETASGFSEKRWRYRGDDALQMTDKLARGRHEVSDGSLIPGDIIGIHKKSGKYGHIAVYVGKIDGKHTIAENTSSRSRGNPRAAGTKLTPYEEIAHRVTGVYRLLWGAPKLDWPEFRAFVYVGNQCKEIMLVPGGDHREDQGKTYWRFKP